MAWDRDQWWAFVKMVMNLQVTYGGGGFLDWVSDY
jgi:hypothetical protein